MNSFVKLGHQALKLFSKKKGTILIIIYDLGVWL